MKNERISATRTALEEEIAWRKACETLTFEPPKASVAKRHLLEMIRWCHPGYKVGWFVRELCRELEEFSRAVAAGENPRLMISAPPRHGKSEAASRYLPVFHLAHNPAHEVVVASYGQDLADNMSRDSKRIRDGIQEWFPNLAPSDKDGVQYWITKGGGSYKAVGAGGPLTGYGANLLIIDDPFKNSDEADSIVIRDGRWGWYLSTVTTRLAPGGGVLLMNTRWHNDDMTGRALQQLELGQENWKVVSFPALAEYDEPFRKQGEALHEERYSRADLEHKRGVVGSRVWNALYQQRPVAESGGLFKREWFSYKYSHDPQRPPRQYDEIVISVDATFKGEATSDYVSMTVWGRYGWIQYDLLDRLNGQMSYVDTRSALRNLHRKWPRAAILIEEKANGAALISDLKHEIPNIVAFKPDKWGNKVSRAQLATPMWESGCVRMPPSAPWLSDFVEQHASFPLGVNDDDVDSGTQVFLWWHERKGSFVDDEALNRAIMGILELN